MKTLSLVCLMGILYLKFNNCYSQTMYDEYKGQIIYVKKSVAIKPYSDKIRGFYKTPSDDTNISNIVYPIIDSDGHAYWSNRDSLLNKKFKCIEIINKGVNVFLKLQNDELGIVYFTDLYMDTNLITEVELQKQNNQANELTKEKLDKSTEFAEKMKGYNEMIKNPCLQIDESYDDFSHMKKFETGYFKPENPNNSETLYPTHEPPYDIIYYKEKSKNGINYFMGLTANSITALARERGVIIILKNKKRINKPNAIVETEVNAHGDDFDKFIRRSYIKLDAQDIQLLKQSPIDEFELYDEQVSEIDYDNLHKVFLCLLTK